MTGSADARQLLSTVLWKQLDMGTAAANTTMSAQRLQQRLLVLERFFAALDRQMREQLSAVGNRRTLREDSVAKQSLSDRCVVL